MWKRKGRSAVCTVNRQQLIEENINLVYFVVHTYYPTFAKDEDIIQCGMLGLCLAADAWDAEQGAFSTFATRCISNQIIKEFQARKRCKGVLSLDFEYQDGDGESVTLADTTVGTLDVDWVDVDEIRDNLDDIDQQIFDLKQSGMKNKEIAELFGWSNQVVAKRLRLMKLQMEGNRWKCK